MRDRSLYTKTILTAIAGLLAWNTLVRQPKAPAVHAESPQYAVEVVTANAHLNLPFKQWASGAYPTELAEALNDAAKGRELVTVIWLDQSEKYVAIFRQASSR